MQTTISIKNRTEACNYTTLGYLSKTVAATGTPERLSATAQKFTKATFYGRSTAQGTNNTTSAWLGWASANGAQWIEIPAGGEVVIEPSLGRCYDLYDIYCDIGVNGEGVVVSYES